MLVEENGIGWGELYCTVQARLIDKEQYDCMIVATTSRKLLAVDA
jgi:hypothetical protein